MTWYAIWATLTGSLMSLQTEQPPDPLPTGLSVTVLEEQPTGVWDRTTHAFVVSTLRSVLSLKQFWDRWTPDEREALMNLQINGTTVQKNKLGAFKDYVRDAGVVDCNDSYIQAMGALAESAGILAVGRAEQILA